MMRSQVFRCDSCGLNSLVPVAFCTLLSFQNLFFFLFNLLPDGRCLPWVPACRVPEWKQSQESLRMSTHRHFRCFTAHSTLCEVCWCKRYLGVWRWSSFLSLFDLLCTHQWALPLPVCPRSMPGCFGIEWEHPIVRLVSPQLQVSNPFFFPFLQQHSSRVLTRTHHCLITSSNSIWLLFSFKLTLAEVSVFF